MPPARRTLLVPIAGFFLLNFVVFAPVLWNGFIVLDDGLLIYENNTLREFSLRNLATIFTSFDPELYIPLTILSYQFDYFINGYEPFMYHFTNLILHSISSFLVFAFIFLLTKRKFVALFTAIFFAIHPLQVEAVAWAAARKDVLSTMFFFATLVAYLAYRDRCSLTHQEIPSTWWRKNGALFLFFLGLLAKASIIFLPFILLIVDFYQQRKPTLKMFIEKVPFFTLSFIFGVIAILGKARRLEEVSLLAKILVAPKTTMFYIAKLFFPFNLSIFYPLTSEISIFSRDIFVPFALLILLIFAFIFLMRRGGRDIPFAVLFFFIMVAPSYFVISKGTDIFFASDRYAYIPIVGALFLIGTFLQRLCIGSDARDSERRTKTMTTGVITVAVFFAILSFSQSLLWGSSTRLFERAVAVTPEFAPGHSTLAITYRQDKRLQDAKNELYKALELDPTVAATHGLLGQIHAEQGSYNVAVEEFTKGITMTPDHYELHHGLGQVYEFQGKIEEALAAYEHAVTLMPLPTRTYDTLARKLAPRRDVVYERIGNVYGKQGDHKKAIEYYNLAIEENPYYADAYFNMGVAYGSLRKIDEAIVQYERAIELGSWHVKSLVNLGILYGNRGDTNRAIELLERALKVEPANTVAKNALKRLKRT